MKLTQRRGEHYLTQIRVIIIIIILVLSRFMLLSIVQQVANRKNIRWERNLLCQECTYEVQGGGFFFFKKKYSSPYGSGNSHAKRP